SQPDTPTPYDSPAPQVAAPPHITTPTCDRTDHVPAAGRDNAAHRPRSSTYPHGRLYRLLHTSATTPRSPHNPVWQCLPPGFASCALYPAPRSPAGCARSDILSSLGSYAARSP